MKTTLSTFLKSNLTRGQAFWLLLLVCCLTLLPFLGLTDYHTKGEPRESVVSYSMLNSGDWVLPRNNGGEMAYKPPFFHWCVAAVSALRGQVTEGASRLPSAVALIAMTLAGFCFYARRRDTGTALLASLVAFTTFELHRAGGNCRVDMLLTATTVGALFALYKWYENGRHGLVMLIVAILLMGVGTLTKGPVGILIPCLVMGSFMLLRGENFFKAFFQLFIIGLLSLIPYAIWFYAAWRHGGQEFLDLMYDENIGRMTGTMTYKVHVEPWYYNFLMVLLGFLTWTLLALITLFFMKWRRPSFSPRYWWSRMVEWVRTSSDIDLFSLTAIVVILVFYTIPECKRSVYVMPVYPFLAYFVARLVQWTMRRAPRALFIYGSVLSVVTLLAGVLMVALKTGLLRRPFEALAGAPTTAAFIGIGTWWQWVIIIATTVAGIWWWLGRRDADNLLRLVLVLTFALYLSVDGVYSPAILNQTKSLKTVAADIDRVAPEKEGRLYEYIEKGVKAEGDPVHFFEVNFYLGNRIGNFHREKPSSGFLLISSEDAALRFADFEQEGYHFDLRYATDKRHLQVYAFTR